MSIYDLEKIRLNLFVAPNVDETNFNWMLKSNKITKEEYAALLNDYKQFLKRYKVLNDELSFKEPISIYALFVYMYKNGFLSKDKEIEFKDPIDKGLINDYRKDVSMVLSFINSLLKDKENKEI